MNNINKTNNTKQTFWFAVGNFSSFGFAILSSVILSRYFDKGNYGTYRQIIYIYTTLVVVFSAGLPNVYSYFLPKYSKEEAITIINKINKLLLWLGFLFSLTLYLFSDLISLILKNDDLSIALKYFSPVPFFMLPTLGLENILATYKRGKDLAIYNFLTKLLMLLCIVLPVVLYGNNFIYSLYGWVLSSALVFFVALYFKFLPFVDVKAIESKLRFISIFSYSIPILLTSLFGVAIKAADQFYISRYFGSQVFAEYSNGFIELPIVTMINGATTTVLMPLFVMAVYNKEKDKLISTWKNAIQKSSIIVYPIVVYCIFYANDLMVFLFSPTYEGSSIYFQINLIINFFNILVVGPLFFSMGKTRIYMIIHFWIAIFIWISDYLLLLAFNKPEVIVLNSQFWNVVKLIYLVYISSRLLNIEFKILFPIFDMIKRLAHPFLCVVLTIKINKYFSFDILLINLIFSLFIYMIFILFFSKFFKINYWLILKPLFSKVNE